MRFDLDYIRKWVAPGSRVLDLGCGDGTLLKELVRERDISGYGLEIDPEEINLCIEKGVNVIEQDLDLGLSNFTDNSFDTVIMTQTLQAVRYPDLVLDETLRIGKQCVITFPNFGHWRCRTYLGVRGRMPVSEFMPHSWYDTPNIHFCTINDFEALCREKSIRILDRLVVDERHKQGILGNNLPNLFGVTAVYHLSSNDPGV